MPGRGCRNQPTADPVGAAAVPPIRAAGGGDTRPVRRPAGSGCGESGGLSCVPQSHTVESSICLETVFSREAGGDVITLDGGP